MGVEIQDIILKYAKIFLILNGMSMMIQDLHILIIVQIL